MSLPAASSHADLCAHTPLVHRCRLELLRDMLHESVQFGSVNDENPMLLKAFDMERAAHGATAERLAVAKAENERLRAYCGAQIARSEFATADDMRAALDRERAAHTATAKELWDLTAERDATATASNSV